MIWIPGLILLSALWLVVWGVRSFAVSQKITAEKVNVAMVRARFADASGPQSVILPSEAKRRDGVIREIAVLVNQLDFQEREKNRGSRVPEDFYAKLTAGEKSLFIDLTVRESMENFMAALDAMPAEKRKAFVEQGLREVIEGRTAEEMERAKALGDDLLKKISEEGMRAYFEKASVDTKLDLAPLMGAVHETMQGLRGNQWGPVTE
jgi:hypothetical protein